MLDICISFDYELFFGENFDSEDEILFKPTREILKLFKKYNATSTFFVDICSYQKYKELGNESYCRAFEQQLNELVESRQDIQLHIHPHWIHSTYSRGKWEFDPHHYKIQDFDSCDDSGITMDSIIKSGISTIQDIIGADYRCVAFRAGGLALQPEHKLISTLIQNGIRIDSSIAPQMYFWGASDVYNYKNTPRKLNWKISSEKGVNIDDSFSKQTLFEVPVATIKNNIVFLLSATRKIRFGNMRIKNENLKGSFFSSGEVKRTRKIILFANGLLRKLFGYSMLSLDTKNYKLLAMELERIHKNHNCEERDAAISIICHPKMLNQQLLENMGSFIETIQKQPEKFNIMNMSEIARKYLRDNMGSNI